MLGCSVHWGAESVKHVTVIRWSCCFAPSFENFSAQSRQSGSHPDFPCFQDSTRVFVFSLPFLFKKDCRLTTQGRREPHNSPREAHNVAIKKLWFSFLLLLVWVVNLVKSLKVACNKNFLFWHHWFFCTRMKIRGSYEPRKTISCFPEQLHSGNVKFWVWY